MCVLAADQCLKVWGGLWRSVSNKLYIYFHWTTWFLKIKITSKIKLFNLVYVNKLAVKFRKQHKRCHLKCCLGPALVKSDVECNDVKIFGERFKSCITYTDEVMLREAAGSDVVLQQLLGEVLVHLCCFMGVSAISEGFVQVWAQHKTQLVPSTMHTNQMHTLSLITNLQSLFEVLWRNFNQTSMLFWCIREKISSPFNSAEDQSWTDISGILLASCMAGTTMLLLSYDGKGKLFKAVQNITKNGYCL